MSTVRHLRSSYPGTSSGGAIILRPDWTARRRAVVGSPAHLAMRADELFATMIERRRAQPVKPGAAEAALSAIAAGIEAASRPAPVATVPGSEATSWQPCRTVDPSAGLAALSASLAAVSRGAEARDGSERPPRVRIRTAEAGVARFAGEEMADEVEHGTSNRAREG